MNEIIYYIDNYCLEKNIEHCKFELYLDFKLNQIIRAQLTKNKYITNKKISDFSFKNNLRLTKRNINKNLYEKNILK